MVKDLLRQRAAWAGLAAGLLALSAGAVLADDKPRPPPPTRVALDASLGRTLDGKPVRLSDFEGKPVVVMFWASWCPHCRNELPQMERLQLAATSQRVRVVAVNVEERDVFRRLHRTLADRMQLLHTYDPDQSSAKAFSAPGSLPYTLVVRADGTIAKTMSGWCESGCLEDIARHVDEALAAAAASAADPAAAPASAPTGG
jgi:thiol-disulfide isomerase/thioredoxin